MNRFCPKCGAYWDCDCLVESEIPKELLMPIDASCPHDWVEAVGVDVDFDLDDSEAPKVLLCRLCGLFAVQVESRTDAS